MRLFSSEGRLVPGRCGAVNKCDYCARLAAVEITEALALDALESGNAPRVWMVLGTRSRSLRPSDYYAARRELWRRIKKRWPSAEHFWIIEATTGYGVKSGGWRRPHWNILVKGVSVEDLDELREMVAASWCKMVDALPEHQYVGTISEAGGLMRYLGLHFLKESQRLPKGWKGHRHGSSHGYFAAPMWKVREEAKRALSLKRELWKLARAGVGGEGALFEAELAVVKAKAERWELVAISVDQETGELRRVRAAQGGEPSVCRLPVERRRRRVTSTEVDYAARELRAEDAEKRQVDCRGEGSEAVSEALSASKTADWRARSLFSDQ